MGNSGGAATHSGIDFQQRIAALVMSHMLCDASELDLLGFGDVQVDELRFETADKVDDLVLVGPAGRLFIQAKNTISLSAAPSSDFGYVLAQFVSQYVGDNRPGDVYVIATSTEASSNVRKILRKLTEAARLNVSNSKASPLTNVEKDVLQKTETIISYHYQAVAGAPISPVEIQRILARIRICSLDFREGGALEAAALLMLGSKAVVPPRLLWSALIAFSVSLARDRLSLNAAGLKERMGRYVSKPAEDNGKRDEVTSEIFTKDLLAGLSYGREVVLVRAPVEECDFLIADVRRFDDAGARRVKFSEGYVEIAQGERWELVGRWATYAGLERYLDRHLDKYQGTRLVVAPSNFTDNPNQDLTALAHGTQCAALASSIEDPLLCRHCGDPISEDGAPLVEVDEEGVPADIGLVHEVCRTPTDRVLGGIDAALFRENGLLRNFDYKGWLAAVQGGQWLFGGLLQSSLKLASIAWKSEYDDFSRGTWCIALFLEDGAMHYVTDRGRVSRFSAPHAAQAAEEMNRGISQAREAGDPFCYTADGSVSGTYSRLLSQGHDPAPCTEAKVVQYTRAIGNAYSDCKQHYAPLTYLVDTETGDPIAVEGVISLLHNPLELDSYVQNWAQAGIELPDFTVSTILTDEQFDRFVRLAMTRGMGIVINPKLTLRGELVSGFWVENFEQLVRSATATSANSLGSEPLGCHQGDDH
ncbi:hypothetical protein [Streptomyces uncialis]|uniref:hypothetical protein n=1 Tax=Streptomyces uncialis TaxID=1048205 RepID=UPI003868EACD|nr:hypothetical protein OG268_20685 [Streptomyces uncialis]